MRAYGVYKRRSMFFRLCPEYPEEIRLKMSENFSQQK
jgi:hypothetical protein